MAKETNNSQTNTIVGPNTVILGNLDVNGSVLIYGTVNGDVRADGLVRTAKESLVKGTVTAKEAVIDGELDGNLYVQGRVTLGSSACVIGNVKVEMLIIEEGAQFSGKCKMKGAKISDNGAIRSKSPGRNSDEIAGGTEEVKAE